MKNTKPRSIYDSIANAASGLSLPFSVIGVAKGGRCLAFGSQRAYRAELTVWLALEPEVARRALGADTRRQVQVG
jgi:hypothetical protein